VKVLVYGAGAVGAFFGGRLARAGADVTFLARGAQLAALRDHGLTVHSVEGDFALPVRAVGRLEDAPDPDLVLLAVKAHDVPAAARALVERLGPGARVMSLQNGVESPLLLGAVLGPERVIAATAFIGARVEAPGVVAHTAAGMIRAGRYPEGTSETVEGVAAFLADHGVRITVSPRIRRDLWRKLLWNVGFNGPSALTRATVGRMLGRAGVFWLIRGLVTEAAAVARAEGIDLPFDVVERTCGETEGLADFKTSMLQDVEAGRPVERDPFYGFLEREGERLGVDTPLASLVNDALALLFEPASPTP
jgi:2-dehydropantoate 2-reductase